VGFLSPVRVRVEADKGGLAMVKAQPYRVLQKLLGGVELRHYPAHTLVSLEVRAAFGDAGNIGFRPLVSYISGQNTARAQIAMTTPVTHLPQSDTLHTISFVLPEGMTAEDAPVPSDSMLQVVEKAESQVAALFWRGRFDGEAASTRAATLRLSVMLSQFTGVGEVFFARYDPPMKPVFLRRNEALLEVS
jgi:hypothetical protein